MTDRTALITGAGTGIGRAIALELARLGAPIAALARTSLEAAQEVVDIARSMGVEGCVLHADVRHAEDCESSVQAVLSRFGKIDILINNAGITRDGLTIRMTEENWDDVIDTNLRSVFLMTRAALGPMLLAKRGKIVNITSVAGIIGNAGQANYSASKAAVGGFTRSVAKEAAAGNVQINAVAPGFIETRITAALAPEQQRSLLEKIPAGRFGNPSDVSALVAFLCTDRADYITGQTFAVDGGMTA